MNCYRIEEVQEGEPLFQHIDATYVLHLENNGRIDRIKKELRQYYPSKNTFVLFNKGYRKCPKNLPAPETRFDIVDANLYIFRDAKEKGFKNILVLEDDFFFDSKIYMFFPSIRWFSFRIQMILVQKLVIMQFGLKA